MKKYIALILTLGFLTSCAINTNSGVAVLFAEVKEPVVANNGVAATKTGKACQETWFNLFSTGDSSVEAAKQDGKITNVATVNREIKHIIVHGTSCTVVTGN